jgi:hypothetical protein
MLGIETCDICKKRFLVRPSKYSLIPYYPSDCIQFTRRNVKDLNVGADSYSLHICPGCFTDITTLIATTYDLDNMKVRIKHWENQVKRHEQ